MWPNLEDFIRRSIHHPGDAEDVTPAVEPEDDATKPFWFSPAMQDGKAVYFCAWVDINDIPGVSFYASGEACLAASTEGEHLAYKVADGCVWEWDWADEGWKPKGEVGR